MDDGKTSKLRLRAKEIAHAVLLGRMAMLEACGELAGLGHTPNVMSEETHIISLALQAKLTTFLSARCVSCWDPQVLLEKDREIAEMEARWKESVLAACKKILDQRL